MAKTQNGYDIVVPVGYDNYDDATNSFASTVALQTHLTLNAPTIGVIGYNGFLVVESVVIDWTTPAANALVILTVSRNSLPDVSFIRVLSTAARQIFNFNTLGIVVPTGGNMKIKSSGAISTFLIDILVHEVITSV